MHLTKTKYPISNKLRELAHRRDPRTPQLLEILGYENLRQGFKWYDRRANKGEVDPVLFRSLCELYPEEKDELFAALEETQRIRQREELEQKRSEHEPLLWAETEKEPYNFFSGLLATALKKVKIPRTRLADHEVERLIQKHFRRSNGECSGFGSITRYRYEPEFGVKLYYSIDGKRLNPTPEARR